jgi:hypothetical protein
MTLLQGRLQVDHAAIVANLAENEGHKGAKMTSETIFMLEFECPQPTVRGDSKWRTKQARHPEFRIALRYVAAPSSVNAGNFYEIFLEHLVAMYGRTFYTAKQANDVDSSSAAVVAAGGGPLDDPVSMENVHEPFCSVLANWGQGKVCETSRGLQETYINNASSDFIQGLACAGDYPSYMQGLVNQSKGLGTDKDGRRLPGPFVNLLQNGSLPDLVSDNTIEAEKATLFWLFDKTQQLGPWAACDDGSGEIPYELKDTFAPGFGPATLYHIQNDYEFPGSNFTDTAILQSAVGLDAGSKRTLVLAFRGTKARSEWISDLMYNQTRVDDETLSTYPWSILEPFRGMAIHTGFARIFVQIYEKVRNDVTRENPDRIIVTGHSLGGGMAQLLALALATDFSNVPVDAAMFAPPTAGDSDFAEAFNKKVNGRRVAYVAYKPNTSILKPLGDLVPQTMCPNQYVCNFLVKNESNVVPVRTKLKLDIKTVSVPYQAVGGNVLFDYRYLPTPPGHYGLPEHIIQDTWRLFDGIAYELNAHICSYSCFLSTAVNAELTKCFIKATEKNRNVVVDFMTIGQVQDSLPANVQNFGLC